MGLPELQKLADLITDEYRERGYVLARAYIPAQEIKEGVVEIAILEGRVGEIIIKDNKHYSTEFIRRGFTRVREDKVIKLSTLERSLLLLNEYPDLKVTAVLQAGREPGTTDIIVNVEDELPLHLVIDYNNFGSRFVSRHRYGTGPDLGNMIIEGSVLSLRGVMGSDPDDLLFGRASYVFPINTIGTKLGLSYSAGEFEVERIFAHFDIHGEFRSYGASLTHPFIKRRFENLTAEFGFEAKDSKVFQLGSVFSDDEVRLLKAGVNYNNTDRTGRNFILFYVFHGLGDALGGMEDNDPLASRKGADGGFTKYNLDLARLQRISESFSLLLRGSGQLSSDSLVAGEQFSIGGADSVRGYPQGEFLGDNGYNVSAELRFSPLRDKELAQIAAFIDNGAVSTKNPDVGQAKDDYLTGAGVGLRLNLPFNLNLRFDVGFPLDPPKASNKAPQTFYIQGSVRF